MYGSYYFHMISAWLWIPVTAAVFFLGIEGAVWVVLIYSAYANFKTDWGAAHSAKAQKEAACQQPPTSQ